MRKVCVVSGNRSDYARLKAVLNAIQERQDLELDLIVIGSHLLPDFGTTIEQIRSDGYSVFATSRTIIEGEDPASMTKSIGLGVMELTTLFDTVSPNIVLISGDRFEIFSAAIAAAAMNLHLAHLQGGEVSGTFDESIRHSITKMAHLHFPATVGARERIVRLGEMPENVHLVGCPSIDLVDSIPEADRETVCHRYDLDPSEPYVIVIQHPVTTEFREAGNQVLETLEAVEEMGLSGLMLYPNVDAGSERIVRTIRGMEEAGKLRRLHKYKHIPVEEFVPLMRHAAVFIGNSSAAIREGSYLGSPAVDIGTRQNRRERGANVLNVAHDRNLIREAIELQMDHGAYPSDPLYGNGQAGHGVAEILATAELGPVQKTLSY